MSKKPNKRSVGIQNTEFFNENYTPGHRPASLQKKAAFRNLLEKSVTIRRQEYDEINENFDLSATLKSKGVQTTLENEFKSQQFRPEGGSLEFPLSRKHSFVLDDESRSASETMRVIEQGGGTLNPGTSRMTSGAVSYISVSSPVNDINLQKQEGSLAVVYSYGENDPKTSMTSSFPYFYGSQGSRRLSDETVLLIEDYQSYDQANVAGMQDVDTSRMSVINCCNKKINEPEVLTKPIPIVLEKFDEGDETACRICHEGEEKEQLIQPCLCKGSIGYVHASCLKVWLEQSNTKRCELCNYPYAIRQTVKYSKCLSVRVFYKTIIDKRALTYDIISFVVISPLTLVGVVMCIQASVYSTVGETSGESTFQMGYITKVGMIMLSGTIIVAYAVWLYTLITFHYKSWKAWYSNCFDVEVIPVRMTSEERLEAARRLSEEMSRRHQTREQGSMLTTVMRSHSYYQRRVSVATIFHIPHPDR